MGARQKLNRASVNGSLFIAGVIGVIAQSWIVFLIALALSLALAVLAGDIRFKSQRQ